MRVFKKVDAGKRHDTKMRILSAIELVAVCGGGTLNPQPLPPSCPPPDLRLMK